MIPEEEAIAAQLLSSSLREINWDWSKLTEVEKAIVPDQEALNRLKYWVVNRMP